MELTQRRIDRTRRGQGLNHDLDLNLVGHISMKGRVLIRAPFVAHLSSFKMKFLLALCGACKCSVLSEPVTVLLFQVSLES